MLRIRTLPAGFIAPGLPMVAVDENLIVDCLKTNTVAAELLGQHGFRYSRPLTRMYRGKNEFPGKPGELCAIVGPEFG